MNCYMCNRDIHPSWVVTIGEVQHNVCGLCFTLTAILDEIKKMANPAFVMNENSIDSIENLKNIDIVNALMHPNQNNPTHPPNPLNPEEE